MGMNTSNSTIEDENSSSSFSVSTLLAVVITAIATVPLTVVVFILSAGVASPESVWRLRQQEMKHVVL